jgi:hypothetical protein
MALKIYKSVEISWIYGLGKITVSQLPNCAVWLLETSMGPSRHQSAQFTQPQTQNDPSGRHFTKWVQSLAAIEAHVILIVEVKIVHIKKHQESTHQGQ